MEDINIWRCIKFQDHSYDHAKHSYIGLHNDCYNLLYNIYLYQNRIQLFMKGIEKQIKNLTSIQTKQLIKVKTWKLTLKYQNIGFNIILVSKGTFFWYLFISDFSLVSQVVSLIFFIRVKASINDGIMAIESHQRLLHQTKLLLFWVCLGTNSPVMVRKRYVQLCSLPYILR